MFQDRPQISLSKEQGHLFMRHGPIDLFIGIDNVDALAKHKGFEKAATAFPKILPTLCDELPLLRKPISENRSR
ncbi:MAG: hypothetical protein QNJ29_15655, partial [Rhizobiaceae bacterium]|nr:hypothetical protein [Rhizobiaceae bacterium]